MSTILIIIGCIILVFIVILFGFWLYRKYQRSQVGVDELKSIQSTSGSQPTQTQATQLTQTTQPTQTRATQPTQTQATQPTQTQPTQPTQTQPTQPQQTRPQPLQLTQSQQPQVNQASQFIQSNQVGLLPQVNVSSEIQQNQFSASALTMEPKTTFDFPITQNKSSARRYHKI